MKIIVLVAALSAGAVGGCIDRKQENPDASSEYGAAVDGSAIIAVDSRQGGITGVDVAFALDTSTAVDALARSPEDLGSPADAALVSRSDAVTLTPPDAPTDRPPDDVMLPGPDTAPDVPLGVDVASDLPPPPGCTIGGTSYLKDESSPTSLCHICTPAVSTTTWSNGNEGAACATGKFCSAGSCSAGCLISGNFYPDGAVDPTNACHTCQATVTTTSWTAGGNGAACGSGQVCNAGNCQTGCWIGGAFVSSGAANAANVCQYCDPTSSTTSWTNKADGTACGGSTAGRFCSGGSCKPGCLISGIFYADGAVDPTNACHTCQATVTTTSWTAGGNGAACGSGQVCNAGSCQTGCWIGGAFVSSGAANAANVCQYCDQTSSTTSWTNKADGTACGGSTAGKFCSVGNCKSGCAIGGVFYATGAPSQQNSCLTCQPAVSATTWSPLADGSSCASGKVCNTGSCQAGCWIGGTFVGSGATNATNTCQICTPSNTTSGWSNNDAATAVPCGTCGGTAACVNKTLGTCNKVAQNYWHDYDGDGYGNPFEPPTLNCNPIPGWVTNSGDCDDGDASIHQGTTRCWTTEFYSLDTCGSDGSWITTTCPNGCAGGQCRSLSTVGTAGIVTCGTLQCTASEGCGFIAPAAKPPMCGTIGARNYAMCDGPNDCPGGQVCCYISPTSGGGAYYYAACGAAGSCPSSGPGGGSLLVCDPAQPNCPGGTTCQLSGSYLSVYFCL